MIGLLLAMYPAPWRRRYGEEFRSLLEERPIGPFDVADVLLGAFDARLRGVRQADSPSANHRAGGTSMLLRLGGYGAIAGGALWVTGFAGASTTRETLPWMAMVLLGTIGFLVALVGLSAFQARSHARLAWAAFAIPAAGTVISLVGLYGMATMPNTDAPMLGGLGAWAIWALGSVATLIGCLLFGAATFRAGVLSRAGAAGLTTSSLFMFVLAMGLGGSNGPNGPGAVALVALLAAFGISWIVLGVSALRQGPIRAIVPA
jgi:hypothetical protein